MEVFKDASAGFTVSVNESAIKKIHLLDQGYEQVAINNDKASNTKTS